MQVNLLVGKHATRLHHVMQVGVTAVLTASPTDVLSHVAIRARSQGVLLATCFDEAQLDALKVLTCSSEAASHLLIPQGSPQW